MPNYQDFRIILDVPANTPQLSFTDYAHAFKDIIEGSDPRFSIGIFGGWGAGKTTLMERIRENLDIDRCVAVDFSAWRYEKEEHLIVPLLDAIRDSLNIWSKQQPLSQVKQAAKDTALAIGGVTESILRGFSVKFGIPKVIDLSFDANKAISAAAELDKEEAKQQTPRSFYFASFQTLKSSFEQFHKTAGGARIVVFIDDLDRCLPEGALEVLESMKLFFDFDGFVFVVGLDQQVVEWCIDNRYAEHQSDESEDGFCIKGSDYIKKIFQVPFALPPVTQENPDLLIDAIVQSSDITQEQIDDLYARVRPHLEHFLLGGNPNIRDIKRYLNSYTLTMKVHQGLDPDIVLALQTLAFTADWRVIFDSLRVHQEVLTRELENLVNGQNHCIGEIAPELKTVPISFERYIANDAPGSVLLQCNDLRRYINLATSTSATDIETSATDSYQYIDLLRYIAAARQHLTEARGAIQNNIITRPLRESLDSIASMEKVVHSLGTRRAAFNLLNKISATTQKLDFLINAVTGKAPDEAPSPEVQTEVDRIIESVSDLSEIIRDLRMRGRMN